MLPPGTTRHRFARLRTAALAILTVLVIASLAGAPEAAAAGLLPLAHPPANIVANPEAWTACSYTYFYNYDNSAGCATAGIDAINNAAAQEGIGPLSLPSNFTSLPPPEQMLVVVNLERTSRGLAPVAGLVPGLNALAGQGASSLNDPPLSSPPIGNWIRGVANWAGNEPSALYSDYDWMYNDGPGSFNIDCPSQGGPGCWDHRYNILDTDACFGCTWVMGAAETGVGTLSGVEPSWAMVMYLIRGAPPAMSFTWQQTAAHYPDTKGYDMVGSDGGVFSFGNAGFYGSSGDTHLSAPAVGMATTPDHHGYWLVGSDGGVFAFGDAAFHGSTGDMTLDRPVVGMASTPDGGGYWLVASDGGVFAFGDAAFHGSMGGGPLNAPIVGIVSTPDGRGYWLAASDGGVFAFGDAAFHGSMGGSPLNAPIVGMASPTGTDGYWLVARDGGIFAFGSAGFHGSAGSLQLNAPIVGMAPTDDGQGYWLVGADGGVFTYGDAEFDGSTGGLWLNAPVMGICQGS